jgi:hypothetical protein
MCLHKQKGILIHKAKRNWALFIMGSLLRVVGIDCAKQSLQAVNARERRHRSRCEHEHARHPVDEHKKKSLSYSMLGGLMTSENGLAERGCIGTPMRVLMA